MTIFTVHVNGLEYGASVGIGPVLNVGVKTAAKAMNCNGIIAGDYGSAPTLVGIINDPDVVDTPGWMITTPPPG